MTPTSSNPWPRCQPASLGRPSRICGPTSSAPQCTSVRINIRPQARSDRPDRRIDYIWLSAGLEASGFAATTSTASDHRGIAVTVG